MSLVSSPSRGGAGSPRSSAGAANPAPPAAPPRRGAIVLLGVPGAGKGTQAKRLVARYGLPHISTGDAFREMAQSDGELGRRVVGYMRQGSLVPDEVVCQVVAARIARDDCRNGYFLDGFPRTLTQAEWLMRYLGENGQIAAGGTCGPFVIYLTVGYNDLYRRLLGRRSCPKCGRIYNDFTQPPREAGHCDADKATLEQRKDDDPRVIRERLSAYEEQTLPLVEFFRRQGRLLEIAGGEAVDRVSQRIYAALDERGGAAEP